MPRERFAADDAREWLNRAESSLAHAKAHNPDVYLEDLCYSAQQATEKALKALLLRRQGRFPYVHDIGELLRLVDETGESVPAELQAAKVLTDYAVETRYPGQSDPVTEEEYRRALELAGQCVEWVRRRLAASR